MGLSRIKDLKKSQREKDKYSKNTTMESRVQAIERKLGLR